MENKRKENIYKEFYSDQCVIDEIERIERDFDFAEKR